MTLRLPKAFADAIIEQARAEHPNEACGLLAGTNGPAYGRQRGDLRARDQAGSMSTPTLRSPQSAAIPTTRLPSPSLRACAREAMSTAPVDGPKNRPK